MKKFLASLLVLVIVVGGAAAYFFLSNGKMLWNVVRNNSTELSPTLNTAITKVHDYGNFDIVMDTTLEDKTAVRSELLIKFDGETRYFSAVSTKDKTTTSYYCEDNGGVAKLYKTQGETKTLITTTWGKAMSMAVSGKEDAKYYDLLKIILDNDYEISQEIFVSKFKSAKLAFSFSPLYFGSRLDLDENVYEISNRGIIRKMTRIISENESQSLLLNKPGKEVKITNLTEAEKAEFVA